MGGLTRVTRRGRGWEPEQNTDNDTQGMKHIFKQVQYTPVPESTLVHARTEKHTCQGEQHTVLPTRAFDRVRCGWGASRADGPPVRASTCRDAADMTITAGLLGGGGQHRPHCSTNGKSSGRRVCPIRREEGTGQTRRPERRWPYESYTVPCSCATNPPHRVPPHRGGTRHRTSAPGTTKTRKRAEDQ